MKKLTVLLSITLFGFMASYAQDANAPQKPLNTKQAAPAPAAASSDNKSEAPKASCCQDKASCSHKEKKECHKAAKGKACCEGGKAQAAGSQKKSCSHAAAGSSSGNSPQ